MEHWTVGRFSLGCADEIFRWPSVCQKALSSYADISPCILMHSSYSMVAVSTPSTGSSAAISRCWCCSDRSFQEIACPGLNKFCQTHHTTLVRTSVYQVKWRPSLFLMALLLLNPVWYMSTAGFAGCLYTALEHPPASSPRNCLPTRSYCVKTRQCKSRCACSAHPRMEGWDWNSFQLKGAPSRAAFFRSLTNHWSFKETTWR